MKTKKSSSRKLLIGFLLFFSCSFISIAQNVPQIGWKWSCHYLETDPNEHEDWIYNAIETTETLPQPYLHKYLGVGYCEIDNSDPKPKYPSMEKVKVDVDINNVSHPVIDWKKAFPNLGPGVLYDVTEYPSTYPVYNNVRYIAVGGGDNGLILLETDVDGNEINSYFPFISNMPSNALYYYSSLEARSVLLYYDINNPGNPPCLFISCTGIKADGTHMLIIKTSLDGIIDQTWQFPNFVLDLGRCVQPDKFDGKINFWKYANGDIGGLLVTGGLLDANGNHQDAVVYKLDFSNNSLQQQIFTKPTIQSVAGYSPSQDLIHCSISLINDEENGYELKQIIDGGDFILSIRINYIYTNWSGSIACDLSSLEQEYYSFQEILMRLDYNDLHATWAKNIGQFEAIDFRPEIEIENSDHSVMVLGAKPFNHKIQNYLAKCDYNNSGNIIWEKTFTDGTVDPDGEYENCPFSLVKTYDGGYLVSGNNGINDEDYMMIKLVTNPCQYDPDIINDMQVYEPINNEVIDKPVFIGNCIINPGVTLKIRNTNVNLTGGIEIYPNGRLIIDGATITGGHVNFSNCIIDPTNWLGIAVDGDYALGQGNSTNEFNDDSNRPQGVLIMKNNSKIQNAYIAVDAEDGGVVRATTGSSFINCGQGVVMKNYLYPSHSYFSGCFFENTETFASPPANALCTKPEFVYLENMEGITFTDNTFSLPVNQTNYCNFYTPSGVLENRAYGINAIDSRIWVVKNVTGNQFNNLGCGVHTIETVGGFISNTKVQGSTFNNVQKGIFFEGGAFNNVYQNDFTNIPALPVGLQFPTSDMAYGIFNFGAQKSDIYKNTFSGTSNYGNAGVIMNQTGGDIGPITSEPPSMLKWNLFNNLHFANQTEVRNPRLSILCNNYSNSYQYDWSINPQTSGNLSFQGYDCSPLAIILSNYMIPRAGNTFTGGISIIQNGDVSGCDPQNVISPFLSQYRYFESSAFLPSHNNLVSTAGLDDNFNNGQGCTISGADHSCDAPPPPSKVALKDKYLAAQASIEDLNNHYSDILSSLDNGRTADLQDEIANNTSSVAVKTLLVSFSPLSDAVLNAYNNRTLTTTDADFRDVLIPNSPVSGAVLPSLNSKLATIDPTIAAEIAYAQEYNPEYRTLTSINKEIRAYELQVTDILGDFVNICLDEDNIQDAFDFLEEDGGIYSKSLLVPAYIQSGNKNRATEILATLPNNSDGWNQYHNYYSLSIGISRDQNGNINLTSGQEQQARSIATSGTAMAILAQNLLCISIGECTERIPESWDNPQQRKGKPTLLPIAQEMNKEISDATYSIIPNPSFGDASIVYNIPGNSETINIIVYDISGKKIKEFQNTNGYANIHFGELQSGVYFCQIISNKRILKTLKLVLIEK